MFWPPLHNLVVYVDQKEEKKDPASKQFGGLQVFMG
jgi:hypothetical protein